VRSAEADAVSVLEALAKAPELPQACQAAFPLAMPLDQLRQRGFVSAGGHAAREPVNENHALPIAGRNFTARDHVSNHPVHLFGIVAPDNDRPPVTAPGTHWLMPNVGTLAKDGSGYAFTPDA
jgi:hypothetical protein